MSTQRMHTTGRALLTLAVLFGGAGLMNVRSEAAAPINRTPEVKRLPGNPIPKRDLETVRKTHKWRTTQAERQAAADRFKAMRSKAQADNPSGPMTLGTESYLPGALLPPGTIPDYFSLDIPNWAFSPPLRKFVDTLPGLGSGKPNNLGQYLSVAHPDTVTYPGSDYYEISVRQYQEVLHTDLIGFPTTLRGYVQTNLGTDLSGNNTIVPDPIHYLGPTIIAAKGRPVRIKFTNELPTGVDGDLFIPVDTTVMGAGMGPLGMAAMPMNYTQNRATLHLHGGRTPWISDGTPHQWITPKDEMTPYPKGVSVQNVPDMPDPGDGSQTFFYTNQQSARLMFYHDHSYGITRLNVYAGEAAGYLITDEVEQELMAAGGALEGLGYGIPLIIQDKTFVDAATIGGTDPTWYWGSQPGKFEVRAQDGTLVSPAISATAVTGDLWLPHVYMTAQNPQDISGVNPMGRWAYGPWFWPPTTDIVHGPVPNEYYDAVNAPWEPTERPGVPHPSMGMESFFDTALVNGTAYPTLAVDPKPVRFRVLNASNDRFWNLQLYEADPSVLTSDGRANTEVKMVPAVPGNPTFPELWPTDGREGGVPDPTTAGPNWIQIGTEGGFLPAPAVIPQQPVVWNADPTTFNFGNVSDHSLLLGPAERADVIVDFSAYPGKTFILYNDAPAAFPALDARYDYYTGAPDLTETGGHWGPEAGFGPNTRTVMQITVNNVAPSAPFDLAKLNTAFATVNGMPGVFARSQDPILVAQAAYNSAYDKSFPTNYPLWGFSRIQDTSLPIRTVDSTRTDNVPDLTIPMQPKGIHDEMGAAFDPEYGRMSGKLGVELPFTNNNIQNFILYGFLDPPTEKVTDSVTPMTPVLSDGTQIWKITHNGVDTHPIHFHLFDVQLLNRVGWDGAIRIPDDNELGWKDTVRISPLEDTIVALRPVSPKQPFGIPDSIRPLDPTMPIGSTMGFTNIDPITGQPLATPTVNALTNFGWEYVWHCHILSHEEMDMMRPIVFNVARQLPAAFSSTILPGPGGTLLTWTDTTPKAATDTWGNPANEIGFRIERALLGKNGKPGAFSVIKNALANEISYLDTTADPLQFYTYKVIAFNAAGETVSTAGVIVTPPAAPSNLVGSVVAGPQIRLTWMDNALNETGFQVERSVNLGNFSTYATVPLRSSTGSVTFTDTSVTPGNTFSYRVKAVNSGGESAYSGTVALQVEPLPAAPTGLTVTAVVAGKRATATLKWTDLATNETSYTVQRATNNLFTSGLSSSTLAANSNTMTQTGLTRGTWYYFRVRANNASGSSAWSQTVALLAP